MTINSNLNTFLGKKVADFNTEVGISNIDTTAYRLRLSYDEAEEGKTIIQLIDSFAAQPEASNVKEIIIGAYDYDSESSTDSLIAQLIVHKDVFKNVTALFIGDITSEENEISWIQQSNIAPLFDAFPQLEYLRVRGGNNLELGELKSANLKTLIVETGGLPQNVIDEVSAAQLPNLEHLELWLGSENYGFESSIEDFKTIIEGAIFPKLTFLGLMDSEIQDEIAIEVAKSPILERLHILNLSMGTLSDLGAKALLESPGILKLKKLLLNYHYMTDEMMENLKALGIEIEMEDQQDGDEDDRYIEVSE